MGLGLFWQPRFLGCFWLFHAFSTVFLRFSWIKYTRPQCSPHTPCFLYDSTPTQTVWIRSSNQSEFSINWSACSPKPQSLIFIQHGFIYTPPFRPLNAQFGSASLWSDVPGFYTQASQCRCSSKSPTWTPLKISRFSRFLLLSTSRIPRISY